MSLTEYKRKRDFKQTPEPKGQEAAKEGRAFVIQKHDASHLHYDFRLELEGVLKSWAVPKGPSLDPCVKRLAMQVEDHPVAYSSFEGTIPQGEYGGGTVMLWDRGHWEPIGDPHDGYRNGRIKFTLHGEKLRGNWMLLRTARGDEKRRQWLLVKDRDDEARPTAKGDVLIELPLSVSTGRDLDEISNGKKTNGHAKARKAPRQAVPRQAAATTKTKARSRIVKHDDYDNDSEQLAGVRFTHPDRVVFPDENITKLDLARYYIAVADWILPHISDRPLVLVRCPDGQGKECFYQKHPGMGMPDTLKRIPIQEKSTSGEYVVAHDVADLISLAQIGTLEIHAWGSRADKLERPDRLIFDLDPDPSVSWSTVVRSARQIREFLQEIGLETFVKTTGGKGLHLVVPIDRRHDWDEAAAFCERMTEAIVQADPEHYTSNMSKAARPGKIFIDYLRNTRGATAVVPYSTRAKASAPISVPLSWDELSARIRSDHYTLRTLPKRLASLERDPWEGIASVRQGLAAPMKKLSQLE